MLLNFLQYRFYLLFILVLLYIIILFQLNTVFAASEYFYVAPRLSLTTQKVNIGETKWETMQGYFDPAETMTHLSFKYNITF